MQCFYKRTASLVGFAVVFRIIIIIIIIILQLLRANYIELYRTMSNYVERRFRVRFLSFVL